VEPRLGAEQEAEAARRGIRPHLIDVAAQVLCSGQTMLGNFFHASRDGSDLLVAQLVQEFLDGSTSEGGSVIAPPPASSPVGQES